METSEKLITENLDVWTSAVKAKSSAGRGSSNKRELYGIQKMRELILELAIRGLLEPQDPNDEPASTLLKSIANERALLVKDGTIKKKKPLPSISDGEKPFKLPNNWEWLRLSEVGHDWGQKKPDSDFTYIDVGSINKEQGIVVDPKVLSADDAPSRARKIVKEGTVIYSTVRPYLLNIAVVAKSFEPLPIASTAFAIVHPFQGILASFIYRYLRSPTFVNYVESCQTGIAYPAINDKQFFAGVIPLPPLAEQHRIVAKVDELMALCDQLEQEQESSIAAHDTLVATLLNALTETTAFAEAWERIKANFDTLFTTESSVDQLKQTILQLAVMGKLVEQDPEDEPASELLQKIADEKAKMVKEGKIKKQITPALLTAGEEPYPLPSSWQWCRLAQTGLGSTGKTPKTSNAANFGGDIQFIGPGQITPNGEMLKSDKTLTEAGIEESTEALAGDIMMVCIGGSIGKSVITEKRVAFNQQINAIRPISILSEYLNAAVSTDRFCRSVLENATGSATPIINRSKWENLLAPIPPAEEQHRIVAKVDELMTLCDALKASLATAQATQLNLADSLVEQAVT
ncbi:restriction endonuclease subunit S [Akkermansiaceae bacterium]|nr:restriction endonuclease subunit S [Akkermansiaceae bacterium]MDB4521397.1 restriction endonuclease subunit S [Akkermansiaceae bacterium]